MHYKGLLLIILMFWSCSATENVELEQTCTLQIGIPTLEVSSKSMTTPLTDVTLYCKIDNEKGHILRSYYVNDKDIIPCMVNEYGGFTEYTFTPIHLIHGDYGGQIWSPALSVSTENDINVNMGDDFMVSTRENFAIAGQAPVFYWTPPLLRRKCARLDVYVNDMSNNEKIVSALSLQGIFDKAIYNLTTDSYSSYSGAGNISYLNPVIGVRYSHCILPDTKRDWTLSLTLSVAGTTRELERKLVMPNIEMCKAYRLTLNIRPDREFIDIEMQLTCKGWDYYEWEDDCGESGTIVWVDQWQEYIWNEELEKL